MSRLATIVLLAGLATVGAGQSILFAVLPPLGREIGIPEYQIGLIFTGAALAFMLSTPFWGRKSDVWGRKPLIVWGLLGYAVSTALFGVFGDMGRMGWLSATVVFALMAGARLIYALLSSGVFPASQACLAESVEPERRSAVMASIHAAFGVGMVAGPGLAALLVSVSITLPLYMAAAISGIAALFIAILLPSATPAAAGRASGPSLKPWDPRIRFYLFVGGVYFVALSGLQQIVAFNYQDALGLTMEETAARTGIGLIAAAVATIATQVYVVRRFNPSPWVLVCGGLGLGCVAFVAMAVAITDWQMHIVLAVFGVSIGLMSPGFTAAATLAVRPDELGVASGLTAATQAAGYVLGPVSAATAYQVMPVLPFAAGAVVLGGLLAIVLSQVAVAAARAAAHPSDGGG